MQSTDTCGWSTVPYSHEGATHEQQEENQTVATRLHGVYRDMCTQEDILYVLYAWIFGTNAQHYVSSQHTYHNTH